VTLPWALLLAERGMPGAAESSRPMARAVNTYKQAVTNRAVAETFALPLDDRFEV